MFQLSFEPEEEPGCGIAKRLNSPPKHSWAMVGCVGKLVLQSCHLPAVGELLLTAPKPIRFERLENGAMVHRSAIDMNRDRGGIRGGVVDRVVLEGRDQATRHADAGSHCLLRLESAQIAIDLEQIVLGHLHATLKNAVDTPDSSVIVKWSPLSRSPDHGDHLVTIAGAAVEQPSGVVV